MNSFWFYNTMIVRRLIIKGQTKGKLCLPIVLLQLFPVLDQISHTPERSTRTKTCTDEDTRSTFGIVDAFDDRQFSTGRTTL